MNGKMLGTAAATTLIVLLSIIPNTQAQELQCPGKDGFVAAFNNEATSLNISDRDGHRCMIEDDHDADYSKGPNDDDSGEESTALSCDSVAQLVEKVILRLNLTTEECLGPALNDTPINLRPTSAQAYGYGFVMVFIVCLASLAGLAIIPVIHLKSLLGRQIYEYSYAFMVALAVSALVCDAVLHLMPQVFGLHQHGEEEDGSDHAHEEESKEYLWKSCVVLAGIYIFYLLELFLHGLTDYMKKNRKDHDGTAGDENEMESNTCDDSHYKPDIEGLTEQVEKNKEENDDPPPKICDLSCRLIHPVAWLVIIGDALHNLGDGLAIGAAVSVSLSFGIGTSLAILLHEIPHELGDYAILIKSGIHWFTALLFNFLSALTAIIGLFIGVAVSQNTATANGWILALTAGLFLYIGLVDLLPDLIHGGAKLTSHGWRWWLRLLIINAGFLVSFAVLLLLAVFEERIRF